MSAAASGTLGNFGYGFPAPAFPGAGMVPSGPPPPGPPPPPAPGPVAPSPAVAAHRCTVKNCGFAAASVATLVAHVRAAHPNLRACETCGGAVTANSLLRHMATHGTTTAPRVMCWIPGCGRGFSRPDNCATHVQNAHRAEIVQAINFYNQYQRAMAAQAAPGPGPAPGPAPGAQGSAQGPQQ
ncbi:hypothetical protein OQA88_945 [Cercophora sp. LCS_1]